MRSGRMAAWRWAGCGGARRAWRLSFGADGHQVNLLSGRYGHLNHFQKAQTVPDPRNLSATFFVCHDGGSAPQNADRQTVARPLFHARQFHIAAAFALVVLLIRHAVRP
jgi:hypothetical protein